MLPVSLGKTKAGANEKEPAFQMVVLRKHLWKVLLLVFLFAAFLGLHDYNNHTTIDKLRSGVTSIMAGLDSSDSLKQGLIAKYGQELERNLDRDIRDGVIATATSRELTALKKEFMLNVTQVVQEAANSDLAGVPPEVVDRVALRLEETATNFVAKVDGELAALFQRLASDAKHAQQRRTGLQEEIVRHLHNKKESSKLLNEAFEDDTSVARMSSEAHDDAAMSGGDDEYWAAMNEQWHNNTINAFLHHLEFFMTDPNATVPFDKALAPDAPLHQELSQALEHLRNEQATWHDVQDLLHNREQDLARAGMPKYEDVEENTADDEFAHYTNFQHWHVRAYLEDCLWPTRLKEALPDINKLRKRLESGIISKVEMIGELEEMAANEVVPHYWLHHSADDGFYGHGMDDY